MTSQDSLFSYSHFFVSDHEDMIRASSDQMSTKRKGRRTTRWTELQAQILQSRVASQAEVTLAAMVKRKYRASRPAADSQLGHLLQKPL